MVWNGPKKDDVIYEQPLSKGVGQKITQDERSKKDDVNYEQPLVYYSPYFPTDRPEDRSHSTVCAQLPTNTHW